MFIYIPDKILRKENLFYYLDPLYLWFLTAMKLFLAFKRGNMSKIKLYKQLKTELVNNN